MENKKGGTPQECESLHFFVADKERRVKVTVHDRYKKENQYEMYFEKYALPLE